MRKKQIITIILSIFLVLIIKNNSLIKDTVSSSITIWIKNIVPSILPMYLVIDLIINYGDFIFKKNYLLLIFNSMLLGSPSNAKYIKEFYENKKIDLETANFLLLFSYSPNPLFLINICPKKIDAYLILLFIYVSNFLLYLLFRKRFKIKDLTNNNITSISFSKCISNSIFKTYNILILILGIITFYMIIINLLNIYLKDAFIINIFLEITNGIIVSLNKKDYFKYLLLIVSFGGFSIHSQIKSILEDTPINYNYFLFGRLFTSLISLIFFMFY